MQLFDQRADIRELTRDVNVVGAVEGSTGEFQSSLEDFSSVPSWRRRGSEGRAGSAQQDADISK